MSERVPGRISVERREDGYHFIWLSQNRDLYRDETGYRTGKDAKNAGLKYAKASKRR